MLRSAAYAKKIRSTLTEMSAVCLPKPSARLAVQKASTHCIGTGTSENSACSFAVFCRELLNIRLVSGAPCAASFLNL